MELLKKDFSKKQIINFILMTVMTVMPFIVIKGIDMPFLIGKLVFLYLISIVLFIFLLGDIRDFRLGMEKIILAIFYLSLIISTYLGMDPMTSLLGADGWEQGLLMYGVYLIFFVIASRYFEISEKKTDLLCIFSSVMGIYTVLQYYGVDLMFKFYFKLDVKVDTIGTIGNRNFVGTYMAIFLLIAVSMYLFTDKRKYLIYSGILFSGLLATLTRGAWLGAGLALLVGGLLIVKDRKYYKKILLVILLFIGIFAIMNLTSNNMLLERSRSIVQDATRLDNNRGGSGRIKIWKATVECIKINPFWGSGIDSLKLNSILNNIDNEIRYPKAHNEFLEYLLWGGIVALISYIAFVGVILINLFKHRKSNVSKGLIVVIVAYLAQSFFNISVLEVAPIFWIILGASVKYYKEDKLSGNMELEINKK